MLYIRRNFFTTHYLITESFKDNNINNDYNCSIEIRREDIQQTLWFLNFYLLFAYNILFVHGNVCFVNEQSLRTHQLHKPNTEPDDTGCLYGRTDWRNTTSFYKCIHSFTYIDKRNSLWIFSRLRTWSILCC